jgi:[NiFe] hydrogenase assembly HybE family chaperone
MSTPVTPDDLERAFRRVQVERMQDVPILNPALEVAAIGFREWQGYRLGILLTPWFMNLILLPGENEPWPELHLGDTRMYSFPSGSFEFLLGDQEEIGRYLSCSMLSPVFEFEEQATAVAAAEEIMRLMLEPPQPDAAPDAPEDASTPARVARPDAAMSRRGFLRGQFLRRDS